MFCSLMNVSLKRIKFQTYLCQHIVEHRVDTNCQDKYECVEQQVYNLNLNHDNLYIDSFKVNYIF